MFLRRKIADKVAAAGFLAVVPDFFYGDPVNPANPQFDAEIWFKIHSTVSLNCHTILQLDISCSESKEEIELLDGFYVPLICLLECFRREDLKMQNR